MEIKIKQATLSDLKNVSAVLTEAAEWLISINEALWELSDLTEEKIGKDVEEGFYFVARVGESVAGVFKFQDEDPLFWPDVPEGEAGYVHRVAVRRKFSSEGVASHMLDFAKRRVSEMNRKFLRLDCDASRPKLRMVYEKEGFIHHSDRQVESFFVARYQYEV